MTDKVLAMGNYLIDTNIFVDHLRNKSQATQILARNDLIVSFVTVVELLQGVRNITEQKAIEKLLGEYKINWGSSQINYHAAQLVSTYFLKYNLRFLDALLAATALENNLILVTDNLKHFKFIQGLALLTSDWVW